MATVTLELHQLSKLLADAAELGASLAISKSGNQKPYLSKANAYRLFGTGVVDRWLKEGLIQMEMDGVGTKGRIDRAKIEAVAKSSNRVSWFQNIANSY